MQQLTRHCILLVIVAGAVLFTNLGASRLWDRDEPRNAGCALEMRTRGDAITPYFNGQYRTAKPVLLYWLIMSAYGLFGVNEFAARFWSATLGMGTVLATYFIGRRLFNPQAALWGALILSTSLMFDVAGRAATPDSTLIFFAALSLLVFVANSFRQRDLDGVVAPRTAHEFFPASWPVVALMYALMGLAVLAKGPVGLVLPTAVIGMFLLIMRLPAAAAVHVEGEAWPRRLVRWLLRLMRPFAPLHFLSTCWMMRPLTAIGMVLAVAAPWYVWVGLRTEGEWLYGFFVTENVERALRPMENHGGSFWYYPVAISVGFFPWSVFLAPTLIDVVQRIRSRDRWAAEYVFLSCWVGVYVALFSLAQTKLPNYVTPAYPALALLTGCFVYRFTRGVTLVSPVWPRLAAWVLGGVGLALLTAVPFAAHRFLPGEEWLGLVGLAPLVGGVGCFVLLRRRMLQAYGLALAASAICFAVVLFGFAAERVDRHQRSHLLLQEIDRRIRNPEVGAFGCLEPSWVFYGGRPIRELTLDPQQRATVSPQPHATPAASERAPVDAAAFLADGSHRCVITTRRRWQELRELVPREVDVLTEAPYFLKKDTLVLVGWKPHQPPASAMSPSSHELR